MVLLPRNPPLAFLRHGSLDAGRAVAAARPASRAAKHCGMEQRRLFRLLWLSIAAAVATIALKLTAWALTGSVGLLSDAAESVVNLVAALVAMAALRWAVKPADEEHAYGHAKAEYFSAGVEGALILIAAAGIAVTAVARLMTRSRSSRWASASRSPRRPR